MSSIEIDEQEAEHALCLNNDHKEGTEDAAAHQHCVLLEEVNEWAQWKVIDESD